MKKKILIYSIVILILSAWVVLWFNIKSETEAQLDTINTNISKLELETFKNSQERRLLDLQKQDIVKQQKVYETKNNELRKNIRELEANKKLLFQ